MFVRFRQIVGRLHVSLTETRHDTGRVRYGHVASLGAIAVPPSPPDRIAFWTKLHQRLAGLRIDGEAHGTIVAAIHTRIPMPTQDDQRADLMAEVEKRGRRADKAASRSILARRRRSFCGTA